MTIIPKLKFRLTTKILLTLLGLSLISLVSLTIIALTSTTRLGDYALESTTSLGDLAVSDSTNALENQAEGNLLRLAEDQAAISNALFQKVESEVHVMTKFASALWGNPSLYGSRPSYSQSL